jgi:undecaprenyl phosphate-alpha-L-ara4N flippase subunit ArnE
LTVGAIAICVFCQLCLVGGNLLLKHSMDAAQQAVVSRSRVTIGLLMGVILLALWFFLWLGLLGSWDLTQVYPFEGLSPLLILLGTRLFLGEHISARGWTGIGTGVAVLTTS